MCVCVRVYVLYLGVLCGHGVEPKTSVCTEKGQEKGGGGGGGGLTLVILNIFNTKIVNAPNTSGTILPFLHSIYAMCLSSLIVYRHSIPA